MEEFHLYKDIKARTGGEIFLGVVGPVRTGKSTFVRHFMELLVDLAQETGIVYQREPFYFDRANAIVESLL